jgi:hypothetical protein
LYEAWLPERHWQQTLTIITTRANRLIEAIHDRMPVILDGRTAEDWMNPRAGDLLRLKSLLVPAPDDNLILSPASSLVNSVNNDGPELLVSHATVRRSGACFRKLDPRSRLMVGSNRKVSQRTKFGQEFARSLRTISTVLRKVFPDPSVHNFTFDPRDFVSLCARGTPLQADARAARQERKAKTKVAHHVLLELAISVLNARL